MGQHDSYAELGQVMFSRDRLGRRGGGVILYVKESIQAYEIKLEREADCDEAERVHESFLTQQVLEPTRGENVLDIVLSSQNELVDNLKKKLGSSNHTQIHFYINVKSESNNKKRKGETSTKVTIKI